MALWSPLVPAFGLGCKRERESDLFQRPDQPGAYVIKRLALQGKPKPPGLGGP
jgi:hypothetical protein